MASSSSSSSSAAASNTVHAAAAANHTNNANDMNTNKTVSVSSSKHQSDSRSLLLSLWHRLPLPLYVLQSHQALKQDEKGEKDDLRYIVHEPVQVITSKELLFWDTLAQFQCDAIRLPVMTQTWERTLLQPARSGRVLDGTMHKMPTCEKMDQCCACTYTFDGCNNNNYPPPLVGFMYPDEIRAFMVDGSKPKKSRACLLCIHKAHHEWILFIRASMPRVVVDPRIALNLFQYSLDQPDGFRSDMMWQPLDQKPMYDGLNRDDKVGVPFFLPRTWRWVGHPTRPGVQVLERTNLYYFSSSALPTSSTSSTTTSLSSSSSSSQKSKVSIASTFSHSTSLIPKRYGKGNIPSFSCPSTSQQMIG